MKDVMQSGKEGLFPQDPVTFTLGEFSLQPGLHYSEAGTPFELKFTEAANASTHAFVLRTPLSEYIPAPEAISRRDGEQVDLGEIPSMISSGKNPVDFSLEPDSVYDVFVVHNDRMTPTRISTAEDAPSEMTFDEVKLLLGIIVRLSPEELRGIPASVIADKFKMRNRRELAHFGLQIDNIVATISQQQLFRMFFVDKEDFWKEPTREEVREHLLRKKA